MQLKIKNPAEFIATASSDRNRRNLSCQLCSDFSGKSAGLVGLHCVLQRIECSYFVLCYV